jgi:ABC-type uncharacterized transport system involved in gliding motility auxiliary subunit
MKLGSKAFAVVLLFVALVLVNYLASHLPVRVDTTAEDIYTLSPGTKALLGKLEEPVQLDFYFSRNAEGVPISFKNYGARVQEMLRQYVRASGGKLQLNIINPKPDSTEEEKASASGLSPQMLQNGDRIFFGLVATQADQQKQIPAFTPQREQFLEYDLSQLIYSVQQFDKKKLGLLTSLPLQGTPQMPMAMMRQQPQPPQFVINEWEKTFEIVRVEPTATELPANLDALAVLHPQNLTPKLQFAIDQFLLGGKPVFLAVDPASQFFKRQGGQNAMFGGPQPNVSSDLPDLLKGYGVTYNAQNLLGDLENATQVQVAPGNVVRYPVWLSFDKRDFNATALPTAQLSSMLMVEPGSFSVKTDTGLTVTPLVESSPQSGDVPAMAAGMTPPEELARQIAASGKKTVAALIQGKFKSAFPNGAPKDEAAASAENKPAAADSQAASNSQPSTANAPLSESKGTSTLLLVADTDWLFDDYSVRRINFFGQTAAEPLNDNLAFASNSLEFLSGSQDLVSIRGKGSSQRPFTVVRNMEIEANRKYQTKLTELEARLGDVQKKLTELQGKKTEGNRLVATPEIQKAIEDFQKQEAAMRGERREIRKALREDIESLGNRLLVVNLLATPLAVVAFGLMFARARKK